MVPGKFRFLATTAWLVVCAPILIQVQVPNLRYPESRKADVVDDYFGTKVPDPYRWMEDLDAKEVATWVAAQNKVTFGYLQGLPLRDHFRKRISELWDYPKTGLPRREAGRYFYSRNSGLQRQSPVYLRDSVNATPSLVIDPNVLWPDGSTSLAQWAPSPDARLFAYTTSEGGADWQTIHVRDLTSGKDLPDEIKWMRFSVVSWTKDAKGFFYSRYPEPPRGKVLEAALSGQALYYHRIGTPQSEDRLIYERKDHPTWFIGGTVTEDGRYLLITTARGADNNNRLYYADLADPDNPSIGATVGPLVERDDAEFAPIGNEGSLIYLRSDLDAPNRKIIAIDLQRPAQGGWKTIVAEERQHALENVGVIGKRIVAQYLADVQSRLSIFDLDGRPRGEIALPAAGTIDGLAGREDTPEIFFAFTSPLYPKTIFRHDLSSNTASPFEAAKAAIDISTFETRRMFATSKDGTKVPFFVTARKNLSKDGSNPTMLYGYGGFSVSILPMYRPEIPAWLELGGIWVTASMRGGAEYGEAWHKAGMLEKKQNVFDDFVAVAETLIKERYTSPSKLGIMGGSNGGLLVAAVEQQRPEMFAVALPGAGVLDMLRYDRFTGGHAWATEYGTSSDAGQFKYLIKYSPLHNVKPGACYPATLITTADHDDRVVPSHSFKFAAAMQAAQSCGKSVLIRIETQGSHGYRPTDKRIAELADEWAFAAAQMNMTSAASTQ
jgi:prolyl oligopeptidase